MNIVKISIIGFGPFILGLQVVVYSSAQHHIGTLPFKEFVSIFTWCIWVLLPTELVRRIYFFRVTHVCQTNIKFT